MNFPLITDPNFYAAAIPAVLLMGLSKSGFGAGFGSLGVPLMALAISVPQAAAIFLPLLFVMDIAGMWAYRKEFDRALLLRLLPWGLLGVGVGTLLFKLVSPHIVAGIVGVLTLLFLAQKLLFPPSKDSPPMPPAVGKLFITAAGFTSFVAHAGGPPYNAYMLSQRLTPLIFTATTAYFYFCVNMAKWVPYAWLGLLDLRNFATSVALIPLALLGTAVGVKVARTIEPTLFYRLIYIGMFLTGCKLVYDGFFKAT